MCNLPSIEAAARREAKRLEALWRIVNTPSLRGDELVHAMLQEAIGAMRPDQEYFGLLGHIEGAEFVIDAYGGDPLLRHHVTTGLRIPLSQALFARDLSTGRTQSWEDCQLEPDLPARSREFGVRGQIATHFVAGGRVHVLSLGTREPPSDTPFGPEDYAYIELLGSFFARHIDLDRMEQSLIASEERARRHAERLEALWQIANNPTLRGEDLVLAMLRQAADAIRPSQSFRGQLARIEGDELVVINIGADASDGDDNAARLQIGQRKPLAETIIPREGRTQAWEDLAALEKPPPAVALLGWRAAISTRFDACGEPYVLTFASTEPARRPFTPNDLAYIDVLATSFAKQLEVGQLEDSLRDERERSQRHSERLSALWRIVNTPDLRGEQLRLAMLREAAGGIRPGQKYVGTLGHLEGSIHIIDASVGEFAWHNGKRLPGLLVGSRNERSGLLQLRELDAPRTQTWDDCQLIPDLPGRARQKGLRSMITTKFPVFDTTYVLTLASRQVTAGAPFRSDDNEYIEVLGSFFARQLEREHMQAALGNAEVQARHHAERLEALWQIANNPTLRGDELIYAMLQQAAAAIRPGQSFRGMLWRVQGTDMVVEGLSQSVEGAAMKLVTHVGAIIPLERTIIGEVVLEGGGTRLWDDVKASDFGSKIAQTHSTRALIVTTFTGGATTWGLTFASTEPSTVPLGQQDRVFIDVLASFFANHVQQRWQFERIAYQQSHDVLTGLLNRSQFRSAVRSAARTSSRYAVIFVDVDAFREINESYGHMIGDAVLVEVGNALRLRASENEFVGRIGDDVFGVYIGNPSSKEYVLSRALSFAEAFTRGFSTGDREGKEFISRTAGLGVAIAPEDGATIDTILVHADTALVRAKTRGHGSLVFYETGMEGEAHRRTALRNELAEAIAGDQFELYYQPHVEVHTGAVTGCEALIRWNHPVRGLLLPQHFIPFAEQIGLIGSIDSWVMQRACSTANELGALRPDFRLYFNLSGRQAGDPSVIRALTTAARNGVSLKHLGVEITETDAMRDIEATRVVCRALRRLNVRIAIDDFGTGYSSLSSLKHLPVDILKIDRSFIMGVLNEPHDAAIADTIISIAARFGFASLAEGVETLGEIDWLRQRPCRYMQGYALCHPLPLAEFKDWVANHSV